MGKKKVPRTRPELQAVPPGHRLYQITINVLVKPAERRALTDRIVDALCPDEHEGDCPNPWSLISTDGESFSRHVQRGMLEMIRTTNGSPDR